MIHLRSIQHLQTHAEFTLKRRSRKLPVVAGRSGSRIPLDGIAKCRNYRGFVAECGTTNPLVMESSLAVRCLPGLTLRLPPQPHERVDLIVEDFGLVYVRYQTDITSPHLIFRDHG
jgi:hypothetical protein